MFDYFKYIVPIGMQAVGIAGFLAGGNWVWLAILTFPTLALVDSLLPRDFATRRMRENVFSVAPLWICTLLGPVVYLAAAYSVALGNVGVWQILAIVLGTAWLSVVPFVPASHELYHRRSPLARFVGHFAQICYLDATRDIAHVTGHHLNVGTPADSDTARRGLTLYGFVGPAIIDSTRDAWKIESDALEKRGHGRWSWRHRLWRAILAQLVFQTAVYLIGGWAAVAVVVVGMIVARGWVESFNYFQHYGIVRVEGKPIEKHHLWNHLHPLTRLAGLEITNHADHHLDSFIPYYGLKPHREAILMPSVFVCFLTALIPPIWHNMIIKPALKRWDNEWASPEERELARAQNEAAGWPDWIESKSASPSSGVAASAA